MTAPERDANAADAAEIVRLVQLYQAHWSVWATVDDEQQRQMLGEACKACLQDLWEVLEPHLRRVAYHWLRSNIAPDIASLTQSMFFFVIEALPRLRLDPEKNPIAFLSTVAWRGCYDDYGRYYDVRRMRRRSLDDQTDDAHHWPDDSTPGLRFNEELPPQLADQDSEVAEQVIGQVDDAMVLRAVHAYWRTLGIDNRNIMEWRSFKDPPRSFKEIAAALGPGWTEAAARKRHSRVMEATRDYLRRHGLLETNVL